MDRFQNTVRLSLFGHDHREEHNVLKSYIDNISVGVSYSTAAMTTFTNTYPSFRRLIVDAETMLPVKVETYRLDPNMPNPEFEFDHELTSYYNMTDLSPTSFDILNMKLFA